MWETWDVFPPHYGQHRSACNTHCQIAVCLVYGVYYWYRTWSMFQSHYVIMRIKRNSTLSQGKDLMRYSHKAWIWSEHIFLAVVSDSLCRRVRTMRMSNHLRGCLHEWVKPTLLLRPTAAAWACQCRSQPPSHGRVPVLSSLRRRIRTPMPPMPIPILVAMVAISRIQTRDLRKVMNQMTMTMWHFLEVMMNRLYRSQRTSAWREQSRSQAEGPLMLLPGLALAKRWCRLVMVRIWAQKTGRSWVGSRA